MANYTSNVLVTGITRRRFAHVQLTTSHSQRLNSGKSLSTDCCEWLGPIATWANGTLSEL